MIGSAGVGERRDPDLVRLKACLNGSRQVGEHPGLPVTPAEVAASAQDCLSAGADAVHVHPRDPAGLESLDPDHVARTVLAVRQACPGLPVGVSTGLWITGDDVARRARAVLRWARLPAPARPDFASVNLSEPGAGELVTTLRGAGVAVEVGIWTECDVEALAQIAPDAVLRVLVEIIEVAEADAVAAADRILALLDAGTHPRVPRLLHGEGAACWPCVVRAGELGLATRIGLEDTLTGPVGELVPDNATLVRQAGALWRRARARSHLDPSRIT